MELVLNMAMTLISKTTVSTSVATVTISSIPQTYRSLLIKARLKDSGNYGYESGSVQFNSDSTAGNYQCVMYQNNATQGVSPTSSVDPSGNTKILWSVVDAQVSSFPNAFSNSEMLITNYSSTINYKSINFFSTNAQTDMGKNRISYAGAGLYKSNSAITSMVFSTGGNGLGAGTTFWVYGID